MKLEDVKKINHSSCVMKFIKGDGVTIRRTTDYKLIATIVPFIDRHPTHTQKNIRVVLDGYASLDDVASAMAVMFSALMEENSNFADRVYEGII